ncbi:phosphatidylinositol-specific phospholipase C [Yamadazyma tenuis]|uniref:PLC-like phosphodiesterase n=1 Tax=Candida tenuis (strain ATCC 10573 / BCRC 21748 / CBS 615 / JCM 9827 / NBRC 10315 / NRRL Y-1498 / VKM Y-70) TaxID=590646 RepID=G3AXJ1_CANTC|nr:PLC-like phosphodiesterase [Yamadazyma tenuis ATCC 10573]EGV66397.1 PLC-like phosphodiesterase [Yamadazyma tenuis ATCC 10573]WEJ95487.1 phosphatidylinositol-specific phospholipase C [Yamadazyma tenuis]
MVNYKTWMKEVNDDTSIGKLSIPGTHNSAACHTALPSVQCQGESVTDQLKHGVRFLDIRCGKLFLKEGDEAKDLQVIHGKFPVKIPFPEKLTDVLEEVYDFVGDNDSETVIVSLKQEGTDDWNNDDDEFANCIWDRYINKNKDKWYLENNIPRLQDARGKVILFRRFGLKNQDKENSFGFDAHTWKYNTTNDDRGTFAVQDFCELEDASAIEKKVDYVADFAKNAIEYNSSNSDPKLFVNFGSGANFFNTECWPEKVAIKMSDGHIDKHFGKGNGVIVLDYVERDDWKLVKKLIDHNF